MPMDESAAAPFTDGHWLLSHNGRVDRSVLPPYAEAESVCDSAVLAAHVFAQLDRGCGPAGRGGHRGARLDPHARLSLLLTDGERILATTWGDPLSYLVEPDGVVVASEPYDDDPRWVDVPDRRLVEATPTRGRGHGARRLTSACRSRSMSASLASGHGRPGDRRHRGADVLARPAALVLLLGGPLEGLVERRWLSQRR